MSDEEEPPPSRRGALIAMAAIVLLVLGGLFLSRTLSSVGRLQDCVMAGRSNCARVN